MSVVAVYNMKGGVGKTTTAVNLSYLAATAGQRTLLWDLDPQAASSFAFRVRPRVAGFGKKSLETGQALAAAIKETDYDNLDLLPADFAYRKLDRLLGHLGEGSPRPRDSWVLLLRAIESLIVRLESAGGQEAGASCQAPAVDVGDSGRARGRRDVEGSQSSAAESDPDAGSPLEGDSPGGGDVNFVHSFDTDGRDLQRCGYVLELRERTGSLHVVAARSGSDDDGADTTKRAQAQIDSCWAMKILSEAMSPLAAFERRLGTPKPWLIENVIAIVGGRRLRRIGSRVAGHPGTESRQPLYADLAGAPSSTTDRAAAPATIQLQDTLPQYW